MEIVIEVQYWKHTEKRLYRVSNLVETYALVGSIMMKRTEPIIDITYYPYDQVNRPYIKLGSPILQQWYTKYNDENW